MILLVPIMAGCKTTGEIELPPKPERKEIEVPKNYKESAFVINYYEHLVQEWEVWSEAVENLTKKK